ncbi:MAG TPA: type IV toxin-antitoxin system AbiEi family antitoxin domain-containing protein [Actinophytocola sp.]|uniref:type IV toxin-antitoxin system AbiEi family antitoxin domain-containing protein n=1 Tax=Actinophytocola sp. TaxID=1872138 RepID=UPI002DFBC6AD|nr:type IV toxin-antitoxin system AbiEi family antitoxin domain-containing protein [Actinophytocola sp.]
MSIDTVLRRQAGVISRTQALNEGMSSAAISRRVSAGAWMRMYPRVYLAADHELTPAARIVGAALWGGPTATVSGLAAAWWLKLWPDTPSAVGLTVPQSLKRTTRPGLRLRRRDLGAVDRVKKNGIWVTAVPLTVLESSVELGHQGPRLLDRALQRNLGFEDLRQAHCRNLGRAGSMAAVELLRAACDRAASEAERVAIALLREAGVDGWECGYRVGSYEVDLAFPVARVAVEVDGWAWHSDVDRFRLDRQRQNALVLAGWTVLRFTWHDVTSRQVQVIAEVRRALAGRPAA